MPELDRQAAEPEEAHIIFSVVFRTNNQSAEIVEPGEEPLYFPPTRNSAQDPAILSRLGAEVVLMRSDRLRTKLLQGIGKSYRLLEQGVPFIFGRG
jgi:hypothetical protein